MGITAISFLKETFNERNPFHVRELAFCEDGFIISIQGGTEFHYCYPRKHCNEYELVELGYPSVEEPLIEDYAEDPSDLTGSVYGFVPVPLVEEVISKHGGIIWPHSGIRNK